MPLLNIANSTAEDSIPTIFYHRKCHQILTMKHRLGSGTENLGESTNNEETVAKTKTRRVLPATPSRVLDSTCIFCGKSKYIKKSNTREPLLQCRELRADVKIREYAKRTMNTRLLGLVECRELVAAEAKYHASCYRLYIGSSAKSSSSKTVFEDNFVETAYTCFSTVTLV